MWRRVFYQYIEDKVYSEVFESVGIGKSENFSHKVKEQFWNREGKVFM